MNKFLTIALSASMLLAACSVNETEQGRTTGEQDTYAGMKITIPLAQLNKANGDTNASNEESTIKEIGVYVVDRNSSIIDELLIPAAKFTQTNDVATTTVAVKTLTGHKDVYVIVNPTAGVKAKITSDKRNAFQSALNLDETSYMAMTTPPTGVLSNMSMTGNLINLDMSAVVDETAALASPKDVYVDRNLAKVVVKEKAGGINVSDGTVALADIKFSMVAKNKWSHIAPNYTTANGTPWKTPTAGAIANSSDVYYNNFSGLTPVDAEYLPVLASGTLSDAAKGFYVLENSPTTRLKGNTTAARIKLKFRPTTVAITWTLGTAADPSGLITSGPMPGGEDTFYINQNTGMYWSEAAYQAAVTDGTKLTAADFVKYTGGICYYKIYVAENTTADKEVKRNYYYELIITDIKGPGKPAIDDDPKDPVDNDTWLSVTIKMNKWNFKTSNWVLQ